MVHSHRYEWWLAAYEAGFLRRTLSFQWPLFRPHSVGKTHTWCPFPIILYPLLNDLPVCRTEIRIWDHLSPDAAINMVVDTQTGNTSSNQVEKS